MPRARTSSVKSCRWLKLATRITVWPCAGGWKSKTPVALGEEEEAALCGQLAKALGAAKGDKAMEASILEGEWRLVYGLAESIMSRTLVQAEAEELLAAETEKAALKVAN